MDAKHRHLRKSGQDSRQKVMMHLAKVRREEDRCKDHIRKQTRLGNQTVYNVISSLVEKGYIEGKRAGRSRRGDAIMHYSLTPLGWFRACFDDPRLVETMGTKHGTFRQQVIGGSEDTLKEGLEILQTLLETKTGPPNLQVNLNIRTDEKGHVYRTRFIVTGNPTLATALTWTTK